MAASLPQAEQSGLRKKSLNTWCGDAHISMERAGKMTQWVRGLPAGAQGPEFEPLAPM